MVTHTDRLGSSIALDEPLRQDALELVLGTELPYLAQDTDEEDEDDEDDDDEDFEDDDELPDDDEDGEDEDGDDDDEDEEDEVDVED